MEEQKTPEVVGFIYDNDSYCVACGRQFPPAKSSGYRERTIREIVENGDESETAIVFEDSEVARSSTCVTCGNDLDVFGGGDA